MKSTKMIPQDPRPLLRPRVSYEDDVSMILGRLTVEENNTELRGSNAELRKRLATMEESKAAHASAQ